MAYRTIVTFLTRPEGREPHLDAAQALAAREDAHLHAICIGLDEVEIGYYFAGASPAADFDTAGHAKRRADATEAAARAALDGSNLRWSVQAAVSQLGALNDLVGDEARFADLVVLPKPYGPGVEDQDERILEAALFTARAGVLVVPPGGQPPPPPRCAVIGWNDGDQALAAVRAAMPLLRQAERSVIAIVDPGIRGPRSVEPGRRLSQYLDRHGVRAEIAVLAKTMSRTSDMLLRHASDCDADLLVTGAYGHSRLRQAIFGGATRELLSEMTMPLLLSH